MSPEEIAERVWPGRSVSLEPLGGGITNSNFKVRVGDQEFVLRIGGKDTELLGIDRKNELAASRMAAAIGVGPEVEAVVQPEGYLITRFIVSRPIPLEQMRTPQEIQRAVAAIRAVHEGPDIPGRFDSHRVVEEYRRVAGNRNVVVPDDYEWAHRLSSQIERARGPQERVPCHNDFLNANFLDDGKRIRIVDWEYAGMGDRFFDLANFSVNHEFEAEHDRALLSAYFGRLRDADLGALRVMRFMSDFREAMWGVVQQGISELDFDFVDYARRHFDRMSRSTGSGEFEAALRAASNSSSAAPGTGP